jgi:hypothetical protein
MKRFLFFSLNIMSYVMEIIKNKKLPKDDQELLEYLEKLREKEETAQKK